MGQGQTAGSRNFFNQYNHSQRTVLKDVHLQLRYNSRDQQVGEHPQRCILCSPCPSERIFYFLKQQLLSLTSLYIIVIFYIIYFSFHRIIFEAGGDNLFQELKHSSITKLSINRLFNKLMDYSCIKILQIYYCLQSVYYLLLLEFQLFISYTVINHMRQFLIQHWMNESVIKEEQNKRLYNEAFSECTFQRKYTLTVSCMQI